MPDGYAVGPRAIGELVGIGVDATRFEGGLEHFIFDQQPEEYGVKIIGEKINGTIPSVGAAVETRDADFIIDLAQRQAAAGADWLDVNAGTEPDREPDDLAWLVDLVQSAVDTRLCLDSPNPEALRHAIKHVNHTPMINSISMETERLEGVLPIVAEHGCEVIALTIAQSGVPKNAPERIDIAHRLIEKTREAAVADDHVYIDPLALAIATDNNSVHMVRDTIRAIHEAYPEVHFTCGLSNVSFGMPARKFLNRAFLTLCMEAGLDSAVLDPLNVELRATLYATEVLLGQDRHCRNYTQAYRKGLFGVSPKVKA